MWDMGIVEEREKGKGKEVVEKNKRFGRSVGCQIGVGGEESEGSEGKGRYDTYIF